MSISLRARIARAYRDTTFLQPRAIIQGIVIAGAVYGALRLASMPREALSHMIAIVVALAVGVIAIPICEFMWNYARAPLAIENDALRDTLKAVQAPTPVLASRQSHEDRKSTRLNSSHIQKSRMPSSA